MSAVPAVLDDALEELAACRAEPDTLALFDALHFLREALFAGADASAERQALVRVVHTHRDARGVAVLAALGHVLDDDDDEDPLAPLLAAASLSPQVPDPHRALEAWIVRHQRIVQVQQERLDHAGRLVAQARQSTQLAAATGVALLGVVVLLLLVEGDWLTVPVPDRSTQEDAAGPPAPQATGPGAR